MKTAILYVSTHHGNTKKLAEAIAAVYGVTLIDGAAEEDFSLSEYDCIGIASGIAFGSFYPKMMKLIEEKLPEGKSVFFLYTCGNMRKGYTSAAASLAEGRDCTVLGEYGCLGYDTYGPFKLVGGIAKGHPTGDEVSAAAAFFGEISGG